MGRLSNAQQFTILACTENPQESPAVRLPYIYMLATPCDGEPAHKVLPDKDGLNRTTLVGEESEKRTRLGEHRAIVKEFYRFQASLAASAPYRKHVGICPAHQIFEVLSQDAVNLPVLPPRTKP